MKHYLRLTVSLQEIEIKNKELLNLMNERDNIEVETQVVDEWAGVEVIFEVVEIEGDKIVWQIKEVNNKGE